jgi:DNA polymerase (family 10)
LSLTNAQLAELLAGAAEEEDPGSNRHRALRRASRAAFFWPEEASVLAEQGRSLTELRSVGPWLGGVLDTWLLSDDPPEPPEPPEIRRGFLTLAEVRSTLAAYDAWRTGIRADLQMHTTYSDGRDPLRDMVAEAANLGYEYVAITDHSKGLAIAKGMDEARLSAEGEDIATVNRELERDGSSLRVLSSIEMNLSPEGEGDMEAEAFRRLDLVLGAFHSKLRALDDQTERYLAALRNPAVHVLAHPRGRRFNARLGLHADWPRVFEEAAGLDKALEIDAHPDRQDLDVELLSLARESGVRISVGTDAHSTAELVFMEFGLAAAIRAGIPQKRILNFMSREDLLEWASRVRAG